MKEAYTQAETEVIRFLTSDVIVTSGDNEVPIIDPASDPTEG